MLMTLLYPVGVPLFFAWLLYSIRNVRDDASDSGVVSLAFIQEAQVWIRTLPRHTGPRSALLTMCFDYDAGTRLTTSGGSLLKSPESSSSR